MLFLSVMFAEKQKRSPPGSCQQVEGYLYFLASGSATSSANQVRIRNQLVPIHSEED